MVAVVIRLCGCVLMAAAIVNSLLMVEMNDDDDLLQSDPPLDSSSLHQEFEAFLVKFGKNSPDRLLDERRYEQFKQSYQFVTRHNSVDAGKPGTSFLLELNEWADLFEEELQQMFPPTAYPIPQDDVAANSPAADAPQTDQLILEGASQGTSLNWAGEDNPLGTSVMSPVKNQVRIDQGRG